MSNEEALREAVLEWVREILKLFVTPPFVWILLGFFLFWIAGFFLPKVPGILRWRRMRQAGMDEIDRLQGHDFEAFLAGVFRNLGYRVEETRYAGDEGADLVLSKDGVRSVVQAKRWNGPVGVSAIQEAHTARAAYDCVEAIVVTNSTFTRPAEVLARKAGIALWDRNRLAAAIREARSKGGSQPFAEAPMPGVRPPAACFACGVVVSEAVRNYCLARPERFDGRVYCRRHQRDHGRPA